jgi:dihydrofolate synthase/folylpolyglutamate synthase
VTDRFILTNAPTAPSSRSWSLAEALQYATERGCHASAVPDFDDAIRRADEQGATTLVTGSFHTVGDAMVRLQVSPFSG